MVRRERVPIPGHENPFEKVGFDKEFMEALLASGDTQAVATALSGMRRVVSRALHPDTGTSSDKGAEFFNGFLQAAAKIENLPDDDIKVLATAYAKRKRVPRRERPAQSFESKDFHDGTLLHQMIDMVSQSGESIASVRGSRLLVRPLDFSNNKPLDAEGSYAWYPPERARVGLFETDDQGKTTWTAMSQVSFPGMLKKELKKEASKEERDMRIKPLSLLVWSEIKPHIPPSVAEGKEDTIQVCLRHGELIVSVPGGDTVATFNDSKIGNYLEDGIYTLGAGVGARQLHDQYYLFNDGVEQVDNIYIAGFGDQSFIGVQEKYAFGDQSEIFNPLTLPSRRMKDIDTPYAYEVPEFMYKHLQKSYSPTVLEDGNTTSIVVATDSDSKALVLGRLISLTKMSRG